MKREVDDRGNIVIHGLPRNEGEELWNGRGAYSQGLDFLRSVLEQARLFGPILFAAAVFVALIAFGTLAFFSFMDTGGPSLEEEVAALATASSVSERTGSASGGYGSIDENRNAIAVDVLSEPAGAAVLVDFDSIGTTPLHQYRMPEGVYILSVAFDEEDRRDSVIVLEESAPTTFTFAREAGSSDIEYAPNAVESMTAEASSSSLSRSSARTSDAAVRREETSGSNDSNADAVAQRGREPSVEAASSVPDARTSPIETPPSAAAVPPSGVNLAEDLPEPALLATAGPSSTADQGQVTENVRDDAAETGAPSDEQQNGRLVVLVKPWGSIYVNDVLRARNLDIRYTAALEPGTYRISAEHPVLGRREVDVQIGPDEKREITINLLGEDSP